MLAISEILGILSNCCLGEKYDNFLDAPTLKIIQSFQNHQNDHTRLQTILFIAQLCRSPQSTNILMKKGVIDTMLKNTNLLDRELSFQSLFVIYQLLCQKVDISEYLELVIGIVDDFLENEFKDNNQRVCIFLNEFLTLLGVIYHGETWMNELTQKRFELWNWEWESKVGLEQMVPNEYYDNMFGDGGIMYFGDAYDEGIYADYGYYGEDEDGMYMDDYADMEDYDDEL
jgi:hypothetical protein